MTETLRPSRLGRREPHHIAADAFLSAALIFLVVIGAQELTAKLLAGREAGTWTPPVWLEAVGMVGVPLALVGGALLAWRVWDRQLGWRYLVPGTVGALVGTVVLSGVLTVVVLVLRLLPMPYRAEEGPWDLVIVASLAAVVFLAGPVVTAVRDLVGPREHPRRHALRLALLALALAAVVATLVIGGEGAELALFLAVPAVPAALAVVGMDGWRARRNRAESTPR